MLGWEDTVARAALQLLFAMLSCAVFGGIQSF